MIARFGRYEVLERLGGGGMAEVFRARVLGPDGFTKEVALKRVLPQHQEDADFARMFVDEARLAAQLHHANIVQVLDFGVVDGTHFLTMEWVDGIDVGRLLEACRATRRRIPVEVALRIAAEALEGLHFAHEKRVDGRPLGIVHRDVSPSNILVSWAGEVRVADFGIAAAAGRTRFTHTGYVRGKPQYMSPEQATGDPLDARSDVFAMGLVLHELLTGVPVFPHDDDVKVLERVEKADVPRPSGLVPDLPDGIDELVLRAVALRPADRPASAAAFRRAIEELAVEHRLRLSPEIVGSFTASALAHDTAVPRTVTAPPQAAATELRTRPSRIPAARPPARRPAIAVAGAAGVLLAGVGIGVAFLPPPVVVTPPGRAPLAASPAPAPSPDAKGGTLAVAPVLSAPDTAPETRRGSGGATPTTTPAPTSAALPAATAKSRAPTPPPPVVASPLAGAPTTPGASTRIPGDESEFRRLAELNAAARDWIGARENFGRAVRLRSQRGLPPDAALDAALANAKRRCREAALRALQEARQYEELGNLVDARLALHTAVLHAEPGSRELAQAKEAMERLGIPEGASPTPTETVAPELPWMTRDRESGR